MRAWELRRHNLRNVGEYQRILDVTERIVVDMITAAKPLLTR